jgi:predicted glutamine amidotransferase
MCRHFFLFNHKLSKKKYNFILSKRNSEKHTPLLRNSRDNGPHNDGVGIASFNVDSEKWKIKKWVHGEDQELQETYNDLQEKGIIIIHLRHKCHLQPLSKCRISNGEESIENTHPFSYDNVLFTHNGSILDFHKYKQYLRGYIHDDLFVRIKGTTDSEWLFYIFLTRYLIEKPSLNDFHSMLEGILIDLQMFCREFTLNIIFSTPTYSVLTRYIHYNKSDYIRKQHSNSLYYDSSDGFMVTSEPMTKKYKLVPEKCAIYVDHHSKEAFLKSIVS